MRAHIIPRAFFDFSTEKVPARLLSTRPGVHPARARIGAYDDSILTEKGERVFSDWDRYGHRLLVLNRRQLTPVPIHGGLPALSREHYDYTKLKLFLLSVLWRASVSRHAFFRRTALGQHEERIKSLILAADPGPAEHYSVFLSLFRDRLNGSGMVESQRVRFSGVNYMHLSIGAYVAYFKVDSRASPSEWSMFQLTPSRPLIVCAREYAGSNEEKVAQAAIKQSARRG